jgi:cell division protein FtsB
MAIRQRNDPVRLFGKRLLLFALLLLVVVAIGGVWNAYQKERESAALRVRAEVQLDDLSKRQTQLTSDIANLQTDRGREEVLREQYALAARGEGLIVIVEPQNAAPIQATSTILDKLKKAFTWW